MAKLFKRFVCPNCGAMGPLPARTPFLHCEACGTTCDFDWSVARRHPDWKHHEALSHDLYQRQESTLKRAAQAHDAMAWLVAYRDILAALVDAWPTVYPVRVTEPAYRAHFLEFQAAHNARLATDVGLLRTQDAITDGSRAVAWDGKQAKLATLLPTIDIALAHFDVQDRVARDTPPGFPPDFAVGYMRQVGVSMIVQEWLPHLAFADQRALVAYLGVARQYLEANQTCLGCGAGLDDVVGATRCPYCNAELHDQRAGILPRNEMMQTFTFIDNELALAMKDADGPVVEFHALEGETNQYKKPYPMLALRAAFAAKQDNFYEVYDAPGIATALAWLDVEAQKRGAAIQRFLYREHPRCWTLFADAAELAQRAADEGGGEVCASGYGKGFAYDLESGGTVVRLAVDPDGKRTAVLRRG